MRDGRTTAVDPATKLTVTLCDCTGAAADLARAHLSGPVASVYLAQALAAVAVLGAETDQKDETAVFKLDCTGPLGGFLAEVTAAGTLRGYTKRKTLDDFDGAGVPKDTDVLGEGGTFEVVRSVPGAILASGAVAVGFKGRTGATAAGLDAFFSQSLQRRVRTAFAATSGDDGVPTLARGVAVECPPDGDAEAFGRVAELFSSGAAAAALASGGTRTILAKLGLERAEVRGTVPLSFACRCSPERARGMIMALPAEERAGMPATVDVVCHMCGRTYSVSTAAPAK